MSNEEAPAAPTSPAPTSFVTPTTRPPNLVFGLLAGAVAAVIGALVWAGIAYVSGLVLGYIAIGVGFLVGLAIRTLGRGSTMVYGVAGGALALAGCILGDLLTGIAIASKNLNVSMMQVYQSLPSDIVLTMIQEQDPIGWLIYGIAVYTGFKCSMVAATAPAAEPAAS